MPKLRQNAWVDVQHLPASYSRAQREYLQEQDRLAQDDMLRHSVFLWCWDEERQGYFQREVFHPSANDLLTVASELAPLWARANVSPSCTCPEQHAILQAMRTKVVTATTYLQLSREAIRSIAKELGCTRTQFRQLKTLQDRAFLDHQEAANAIIMLLPPIDHTRPAAQQAQQQQQNMTYGETIMRHLQALGVDEAGRQRRLQELDAALAMFGGAVPRKPEHPTTDTCPFCQQPYKYGLIEWLSQERQTWDRVLDILIGAPMMAGELKKFLAAIERWLFNMADTSGDTKKKLTEYGMTELLIHDLIEWMTSVKTALIARRSDITSSSAASTGMTPPPPIPPDNSTPSTANTSNVS